jgi:nucleoside-diphosphate-sugar epimerase
VSRVLQTSTSEVYGTARTVPISEEHPLQGQSPYSATKIGADKIAESFYLSFQLPVVIVRPFNTYGPRQSARAVIPTIISQALKEKAINLGNLDPTRDLNYVADTVEGFIKAAEAPKAVGQVINLGNGKEISIGKLAEKILSLMGKDVPINCEDRRMRPTDSEVERLCADNRKAKELLGWEPAYTLDEGLNKTIEWIRENHEQYRSNAYVV